MLVFDEQFASGEPVPRGQDRDNVILGCVLWADDTVKRVRFYISPDIIDGVLKGENSVHDHQNVVLHRGSLKQVASRESVQNGTPAAHST